MTPCHVVEIVTPKKVVLNGLWFGPKKPKRCIVWLHGLGSSVFKKHEIAKELSGAQTAVLMFNNRGHDTVAYVSKAGKKKKRIKAGAAHERFADSVDDIQGAIDFARRQKAKFIFLAGHSTGCQKSLYWAYKKKGRGVRGIILLAPISDYTTGPASYTKKQRTRALAKARKHVRTGKRHMLMPEGFDAQRFVSLYSGEGSEEIFTYWDPKRNPRTLKSVRLPVLVLLAARDEFADRLAKEIAAWFEKHVQKGSVVIVPYVKHSFSGAEKQVARAIRRFMTLR